MVLGQALQERQVALLVLGDPVELDGVDVARHS